MIINRLARLSFHSNHKRIASGALLIGILTLIAKLFVAAREMAIAWRFGVGGTVDAYQLAMTAATWVPMMLAGVVSAVLVPRLVRLKSAAAERRQFLAELNGTVVLAAVAITALTWLAGPLATRLLAADLPLPTLRLTAAMTAEMAPVAGFMIGSAYLCTRLQARERFGYSITEAVPAVVITASLIAIPDPDGKSLIAGTSTGFLLQFVVLLVMIRFADAPLGRIKWRQRSKEWGTIRGSFALMIAGQVLITASIPIDQSFASRLGEGSVAILGYANRIVTLISGLGTIVVGRALLPVLSEAAAAGGNDLSLRHARHWSFFLGASAAVGAAMLWMVAPLVVRVVFERGAFSAMASARVAMVLRAGIVQLPFYFTGIALVQWYAATGRFRSIVRISAAALALKVALNAVLTPHFGLSGIMISTAAMYLFTTSLLLAGTRKSLQHRSGEGGE